MNKKFLTILLSVLLPTFLVGAVVYATTSIGNNVTVGGTLSVTATSTLATTTATKLTVSGATVLDGGLTMDTSKFTVADTSGNTAIGGTLNVTGNFIVNNNATTTASNGNFATQGDIDIVGEDLQATTGVLNISKAGSMTTVKGTLNIDEAATLDSTLGVTGISTLATTTATKLSVSGATALGGGTAINKVLFGVCSINPNELGVKGVSTSTLATDCTATGVVAGDKVFVTPSDLEYQVVFHNATSSAGVISISIINLTDAEFDPAASNWDWMIIK